MFNFQIDFDEKLIRKQSMFHLITFIKLIHLFDYRLLPDFEMENFLSITDKAH